MKSHAAILTKSVKTTSLITQESPERCVGVDSTAVSSSGVSGSYLSPAHDCPDVSHPWILCPSMKMSG
jgi:hypothetical protein